MSNQEELRFRAGIIKERTAERDALALDIGRLRRQRDDLATRVAELEAVLPKTADGVPVVPGMRVWTTNAWEANKGIQEYTIPKTLQMAGRFDVQWNNGMGKFHTRWCYSTREAAEAAKGENDAV